MVKYDKQFVGFFTEAEAKEVKKYCEVNGFKASGFMRWLVKRVLNNNLKSEENLNQ